MVKEDGVGFSGVRPPEQDDVGFFGFPIRTSSTTRSEYRRQTGDARGVSSAIAAIDVVRSHHTADELLCRVVQFIGCLGTAEHAKVPRIFLLNRPPKRRYSTVHRLVPGSGTMGAVVSYKRLSKARGHCFIPIETRTNVARILAPFDFVNHGRCQVHGKAHSRQSTADS
jgi:hypothetical protein